MPIKSLTCIFVSFLVDGNWGEWSSWSACTKSCGVGVRMRVRSCDNPPPSKEGRDCVGHNTQKVDCKSGDCCKYKSEENILSNLDNLLVSEEPGRILNNFRCIHFALKSAVLFQSYSICIPWILIASFPCGDFSTVYKPSAYLSKLRRHLDKYASSTSFNGLVLFNSLWSVALQGAELTKQSYGQTPSLTVKLHQTKQGQCMF